MLDFQILTPQNNYYNDVKDSKIYYIYDHLCPFDYKKNSLEFSLAQNKIKTSDKLFIFDSYLYLENFNSQSVYTNDFLIYTMHEYQNSLLNHNINFKDKKILVNCQMNKSRYIRVLTSCWLANNLLDHNLFIYSQPWERSSSIDNFLNKIIKKYNLNIEPKILPYNWFQFNRNSPENYLENTSNSEVFKNCLKNNMFEPTIFSIVLEPIEQELGAMISEKFVNAVYGGNIPIIYGYKIYSLLEKIGFDTFSDIIDVSSQDIRDPYLRIIHMLNTNRHLFYTDINNFKTDTIRDRLTNNLKLLQDNDKVIQKLIELNSKENLRKYKKNLNQFPDLKKLSNTFSIFLEKNL
jgi:hypothetical protein